MYPQNLHWQLRVSPGPIAAWGEAVTGIEDLEQAIRIICLTPKLSVPTEPEKFCDALEFIDRPPAIAIPRISQAIWDGLTRPPGGPLYRWEAPAFEDHFPLYRSNFAQNLC